MSLLVWLPLNGDLRNNGLAGDITVTNGGATVNTAGKIGKCYQFGGSAYINTGYAQSLGVGDFSIAMWVKITSDTSKTYQALISCKTNGAASVGVGIYWHHTQKKFLWSTANGSAATEIWTSRTFDDSEIYNKWNHIVMIRNSADPKIGYFYWNGERVDLTSIPVVRDVSTENALYLGCTRSLSSAYYYTGLMNDFRLYDHALSDREIKELAKGLVAHWKLDDLIGNENLLRIVPKGFDPSSYNSYQFNLTENLVAGDKYTIQLWDVDVSHSAKTESEIGVSVYWGGGSVSLCGWRGTDYFTNGHADYLCKTFTASTVTHSTTANAWLNIYNSTRYVAGTLHMSIGRWKLEKGEVATPWIPSTADDAYSNWELDKIHDSSGYCHDGTLSPTPPTFDSDSARYSGCMKFSSNYIHCGQSNLYPTDEITVAWWGYMDSWSSYGRAISCTESGGWNFEPSSGKIRFVAYKNGVGYGHVLSETTLSSMASGWHFFVGTFDGYVLKIYIDGEYENVSTDASPTVKAVIMYRANVPIYIGCEANGANPSSPYFNGKLSDIRIYATALSAEDIKELYATSASIDDHHNVYAREFIEV